MPRPTEHQPNRPRNHEMMPLADLAFPTVPGHRLPLPVDPARATIARERVLDRLAGLDGDEAAAADAAALRSLIEIDAGRRLIDGMLCGSPYLAQLATIETATLARIAARGPDAAFDEIRTGFIDLCRQGGTEAQVMAGLRRLKRRAALVAAVADLAGVWPLEAVTAAVSDTAELALEAALAHLLRDAARRGEITLRDRDNPGPESGLFALGMGKLGACELNYSSDIDLILLFDAERVPMADDRPPQPVFSRIGRDLVKIMEARTADGYVYRTDLRLRPDPASTPLALSAEAAETYYESVGQNWERAAMIKARVVAGDHDAGNDFLARLTPFVWRKSLDFYAIADIHSIKRQINAHRSGDGLDLPGHNLKLGRGGIREIEFFCQTQQLIFGGRTPDLRTRGTAAALDALVAEHRVEAGTAHRLKDAYRLLRTIEHRLQMVDDAQTHSLPKDEAALDRIAAFSGFETTRAFKETLIETLKGVERSYAELFDDAPGLGTAEGNLVFTGTEDDPDTIATLERMGFREPSRLVARVRDWHRGRVRATRSGRSRQILTEIMPELLSRLGGTGDPDAAFLRFDSFLGELPAGVQIFALFHSNPDLLALVAEVMGTAPKLSEQLARRSSLLEAVIDPDFFTTLGAPEDLAADLERVLSRARDYEDTLDLARRWAGERKFQVGVHILRGLTDADAAAPVLTAIADAVIAALLPRVQAEFAQAHGHVPGGRMAVVAQGRLGSAEMSIDSDLDLVIIYSADDAASDGGRPLGPSHYYARLAQRFISAISALTGEGRLYEIDTRLRPAGSSGPVATRLDAFGRYHREDAWTWEHMALTRARVIAADTPELKDALDAIIHEVLVRPRDADKVTAEVADMRRRIAQEHGTNDCWSVKHVRGGLVDLEFLAQHLQLIHGADYPDLLLRDTALVLERAGAEGLMADGAMLAGAVRLQRRMLGLLRLTVTGRFDPKAAPPGLISALARAAGLDDTADAEAISHMLQTCQAAVRAHFDREITGDRAAG
ncbi:bifunctional [glutamine synthetase] adenylyltransferase/[glutamine synthetase]-adenylyl-L-tyrosine phosphorylase [Tistrella sp. BH-R2-4]|uniref:Bifunctional glutamine synthetase adenylyltransferase/adenylyl-removing enzyme n=1 Tax=Tistrella arctica TaxID=3133430 RepID=A0ABU9YPS7_9PROT